MPTPCDHHHLVTTTTQWHCPQLPATLWPPPLDDATLNCPPLLDSGAFTCPPPCDPFLFVWLILLTLPPQIDKWAQMTHLEHVTWALGVFFIFIIIIIINYFSFFYTSHQPPINYHQHQHFNPVASHWPNIDFKQWPPKPDLTTRNLIMTPIQPNRHPKYANVLNCH